MKFNQRWWSGFLAALLIAASATSAAAQLRPLDSKQDPVGVLLSKADSELVAAISAGRTTGLEVIVSGHRHQGASEHLFANRAETVAALEAASAPFFNLVRTTALATGGTVTDTFWSAPAVKVVGNLATFVALAQHDEVRHAELDNDERVGLIEPTPSDDINASNSGGRNQLQAEDIWALGFRGEGVRVSMIDTGIDRNHEAFKSADGSTRIVAWTDWVNSQALPYDDNGHGTHVAGTAAGSDLFNDPTFGLYQEVGVAPRATLLVSKFLNSAGSGSFANAINSLQWSFTNNADITSNSWGSTCSGASSVLATVRTTTDAGMLSVFAAGNSGPGAGSVGGPACSESAFSIGAVDQNLNIASFSGRGPCSDPDTGTGSRICPDVVSKGVAVRSAANRSGGSLGDPSGYRSLNGTSMATPHAAGAVALSEQMKIFYSSTGWDTSNRAEEQVFKLTSLDLGVAGEDNTFGWGLPQLLNIYALLDSSDEANIIDTFSISSGLVRLGDSTTLKFSVRNLGGATADGTFLATLTDPSNNVTTLKSTTPSLSLLDGESLTHNLTVGGSLQPGTYTFTGSFNYTWVDGNNDVQTGSVLRSGTFDVKRVFVSFELAGLDDTTTPGDIQEITLTATNNGNEDATDVVLELTFPDKYVALPQDNFDPTNLNSRWSKPTPNQVVEDSNFDRITLVHTVGGLAQGESFGYTLRLTPTQISEYRLLSVARFKDGAGKAFSQGQITTQNVAVTP